MDDELTRVLVVEDNELVARTICALLAYQNVSVTRVSHHAQAARLVARADFDVILADVCTPYGNVDQLVSAIRSKPLEPWFVLISGLDRDMLERMSEHYACAFLQKPVRLDDLEHLVVQTRPSASCSAVA